MKVIVFYKPDTETTRQVEEYLRDFSRQTGKELETVNPETAEGTRLCEVYDIVEYPSVVALSDDGLLQNSWRGLPMPLISEVSYYT